MTTPLSVNRSNSWGTELNEALLAKRSEGSDRLSSQQQAPVPIVQHKNEHDPVATIVYKHAKHTVSLTTLPPGQSVSDQAIAGYNVRSWSDPEFTYIAVSDLPSADLASFERAFSAGSPSPETK